MLCEHHFKCIQLQENDLVHPKAECAWETRETDRGGGGKVQTLSHSSTLGNQGETKLETAESLCKHCEFVILDLRGWLQSKLVKIKFP